MLPGQYNLLNRSVNVSINDLSLKTQSVQLNKVTSNTESTIKQHELVSDDAIINELSSELVSCLGNGKFTPISEDSKLFNMLSEFKLLHSEYFEWGDYSLWFQDFSIYNKIGFIMIEKIRELVTHPFGIN